MQKFLNLIIILSIVCVLLFLHRRMIEKSAKDTEKEIIGLFVIY